MLIAGVVGCSDGAAPIELEPPDLLRTGDPVLTTQLDAQHPLDALARRPLAERTTLKATVACSKVAGASTSSAGFAGKLRFGPAYGTSLVKFPVELTPSSECRHPNRRQAGAFPLHLQS